MAKIFDHWDDLDIGDQVEVWFRTGITRYGKFGGFHRRRCDDGSNTYWVDLVQPGTSGSIIPTTLILGIVITAAKQPVEPDSFGEVLDDDEG